MRFSHLFTLFYVFAGIWIISDKSIFSQIIGGVSLIYGIYLAGSLDYKNYKMEKEKNE